MRVNRKATKEKGVYELVSDTKKVGGHPDVCYYINFKLDGKLVWEKIGWLSEGYSVKLAAMVRSERMRSIRFGQELPQQKKKVPLFGTVAERYLEWAKTTKTRGGADDKSRYENHLRPRFEKTPMDGISVSDLERMEPEMQGAGISPKTISHCLGLMRAMFNKAADWDLFKGPNPVQKVKMPTIQNTRDRFLTVVEARVLLRELKHNTRCKTKYIEYEDPKIHDIALLSLHTGARASEIFKLKASDVDFDNGLIALRDTKNTETRYAPMTADVREMLSRRIPANPGDYVFKDENGEMIEEVTKSFERAVDRLGFNEGVTDRRKKLVFHSLRHTFASWLAIQGTPLLTIARLMGHKTIAMSFRYAHLSPDHKKDAVNGLEAAFNGDTQKMKVVEGER
jgi:integrase